LRDKLPSRAGIIKGGKRKRIIKAKKAMELSPGIKPHIQK